jgi:hypothetical protein
MIYINSQMKKSLTAGGCGGAEEELGQGLGAWVAALADAAIHRISKGRA